MFSSCQIVLVLFILLPSILGRHAHHRKIWNGVQAQNCQFPWLAVLNIKTEDSTSLCGGTIIDSRHILTAQHCVTGNVVSVDVGVGNNDRTMMPVRMSVPPAAIQRTANFSKQRFHNDVALLTLPRALFFTRCIHPLPLASAQDVFQSTCVIAGWGKTQNGKYPDRLQYGKVQWYPTSFCQNMFGGLISSQFCAGSASNNIEACHGDSGTPLMCRRHSDNALVVAGITSFGYNDCQNGVAVYTKVADYLSWINYMRKYPNEMPIQPVTCPTQQQIGNGERDEDREDDYYHNTEDDENDGDDLGEKYMHDAEYHFYTMDYHQIGHDVYNFMHSFIKGAHMNAK
ncbi:granzyme B(G,H) [Octopus sinensis]|uniref:Granzyme B(G,H) n=1 Tax=Octopus sinensis TaxID=2607531 RepID=A0A6P7SZG1_9MOLL|nr:granzyme B(G,H) [Octopus sinensis]